MQLFLFGSSTPRHGYLFFDKWHHSASCGRLLGTLLRSSPIAFWGGLGVCFLFVVGVVLWVRSFSQSGLCTSGVVLVMLKDLDMKLIDEQRFSLLNEIELAAKNNLVALNELVDGWGVWQTGGMCCVLGFLFADDSDFEDGHHLMVSPEGNLGVTVGENENCVWLVGHYGGSTGNTSECVSFDSFGDAVKEVERILHEEGVL